MNNYDNILRQLGKKASYYLDHVCEKITKDDLSLPGAAVIDQVFANSNRNPQTLKNLSQLYNHGNLKQTGYLNILPIDQGIEHSALFSFYKNPVYFDPEKIIQLAIEAGCNGVASTFGVLGLYARKYAYKIPFIVKINHNELLTYPTKFDQILFGSVKDAWNMGAAAIGATVYFGSKESSRQLNEIAEAFYEAHSLGLATILWCYTRNDSFSTKEEDYNTSADLTGQANHLGVTIQADIIKQKLPTNNYGFKNIKFGKYNDAMYEALSTGHPIDLCRLQVANCYMGKIGLINSGGGSNEVTDLSEAIKSAVINKRAGGSGLIMGRKAFQKPFNEGVELLHEVQQVYLEKKITIA